jgi:AcrR family transcriptional regulator
LKRETEIRDLFIENAINIIADAGFEKATTKELTHCSGNLPGLKMNEAYIYRIFGSKEKLYEAVFEELDNELYIAFMKALEAVIGFNYNIKDKLNNLFLMCWDFILQNEVRLRCYVRFYYSAYFKGSVAEAHNKLLMGVVNQISPIFKREADVLSILRSVFTTLLDFGIRVYNGELEDNEDSRKHIFNVLYCAMMTYFNGK